jgi:hypothetical protein
MPMIFRTRCDRHADSFYEVRRKPAVPQSQQPTFNEFDNIVDVHETSALGATTKVSRKWSRPSEEFVANDPR